MKHSYEIQKYASNIKASDLMPSDDHLKQILRKRAFVLAKEEKENQKHDVVSYIRFMLGTKECYGVSYRYAKEVTDNCVLTPVPFAVDYIAGMINYYGNIIAVIDLKKFFHLDIQSDSHKDFSVIVVNVSGMTVGILADYIVGSDCYEQDEINKTVNYEGLIDEKYILGVHQGVTALLNVENILMDIKNRLKEDK